MRTRKIVQIRGSHYVNIPKEVCEALDTEKGERVNVSYVPGVGIVISQLRGADRSPIKGRSVEDFRKEVDYICKKAERELKKKVAARVENFHGLMMKEFVKLGVFDLKSRVDGLEKEAEKIKRGRGKLSLVGQRKRSP
jgi:antitoxin component of MazEF toxin-antitoxin module